jgi:shikimate kinase
MCDKLILVGYMGAGKSTIGLLLAQKTAKNFLDLDQIITKNEGKSIPEIFAANGELYFRKLEHQLLKEIVETQSNFVLSLGGGTPCYANNHLVYQRADCSAIYLKASIETLVHRVAQEPEKRPLLMHIADESLENFIAKQLFERSYYYNQANLVIAVDHLSPEQITTAISQQLA